MADCSVKTQREAGHTPIHIKKDDSFSATATFNPTGAAVPATTTSATTTSAATGPLSGSLKITATDDKTVSVDTDEPFYIAGEFGPFNSGAAGGAPLIRMNTVINQQELGLEKH